MKTTSDSIAMRGAGVISIIQPVKGHRFTLDSVLLADFCRVKARDRVLEPGAGTGVVSILLAKKHRRSFFYPVEVQDDLHRLCGRNCSANGLDNAFPLCGDLRKLGRSGAPLPFDAIVANPPYGKTCAGRSSPHAGRKTSRQDVLAPIEVWLDLGTYLKQRGRYTIVFPAARCAELLAIMRERRLEPKRVLTVYSRHDSPASLVLVEAVKDGGPGTTMLPPLVVHEPGGAYSRAMQDIYGLP